jgi:glycine reductase
MRLELGSFQVRDVRFGSTTALDDGLLTLDRDALLAPVMEESDIESASLDIARPGESTRIVGYYDIVEPRTKVSGEGTIYPGKVGRSIATVGEGRTHRLAGVCVISCHEQDLKPYLDREEIVRPQRRAAWAWHRFIDMSGPGAVLPYSSTINVCLTMKLKDGLNHSDRAVVIDTAAFRLSDTLAETTAGLEPDSLETFDVSERDPSLPNVAAVILLASNEITTGPRSMAGSAIYGVTRLSAPWVLGPTEMLDGAVAGGHTHDTWPLVNNPIVEGLCRRHGRDLNFVGCIIGRTNWGGEEEMKLSANRAAQAAKLMGADGAIVTNDVRGRRFVDSVRTIEAFERLGIQTVFVTEEEDNEGGGAPPFLYHPPEMAAIVSTGTGQAGPFPAVERIIGSTNGIDPSWYDELKLIVGRYGAGHVRDHYGIGVQSCVDY